MLNQQLRELSEIHLGGKFDGIEILSLPEAITLSKTKTGLAGKLYFAGFAVACAVIGFFGATLTILLLSLIIAASSALVIFLKYRTTFDFSQKNILHEKNLFGFRVQRKIAFERILDFKIKNGEMGYNLKVKTGTSEALFYKIWQELTLCRFEKYEEALEVLNWIREKIRPR